MATFNIRPIEQQDVIDAELVTQDLAISDATFAQHGLIPNDGVNEIRPQDMFAEVDVADVLVDKKGYPVRFTDGVYDRLGDELITNGDFSDGTTGWNSAITINGSIAYIPAMVIMEQNLGLKANTTYVFSADLIDVTVNVELRVRDTTGGYVFVKNLGNGGIGTKYVFTTNNTPGNFLLYTIASGRTYSVSNISVRELPKFQLPKAPFATGSTDELLDDKVNGVTTQTTHSKGDIVVTGNRTILPTNGSITTFVGEFLLYSGGGAAAGVIGTTYKVINAVTAIDISTIDFTTADYEDKGVYDQSYIALQDTTAGDLLTDTTKFKPIPYVTKQVALLIEKTSTGAILNTVKPLINMYGEESVETYEADIFGELGYSQKADRVWTDGSSEFILVGLKGYLNGGAYHPWFNEFGVGATTNIAENSWETWYSTDKDASVYQMFKARGTGTPYGWRASTDSGFIGAPINYNLRPDGKFYDKTYIEGQNGLICYSIPNAKTPTYKHQEEVRRNLVDGYIENGVELRTIDDRSGNKYYSISSRFELYINKPNLFLSVGDILYFHDVNTPYSIKAPIKAIGLDEVDNGSTVVLDLDNIIFSYGTRPTSGYINNEGYYIVKSPYLATQGTTTHTDLIGDPAPYNSTDATYISPTSVSITDMPTNTLVWDNATGKMYKAIIATNDLDANGLPVPAFTDTTAWTEVKKGYPQELRNLLASGKGVGFMNPLLVGQDGTNYIGREVVVFSKKITEYVLFGGFTEDGETWANETSNPKYDFDFAANSSNGLIYAGGTRVNIVTYKAQNQPAIPVSTPKPIEVVDRDLIASNHHSVYAYNGLTYASSGKIATGSSVESKGVEDLVVNWDYVLKNNEAFIIKYGAIYLLEETLPAGGDAYTLYKSINKAMDNGIYYTNTLNFITSNFKKIGIVVIPKHNTITLDNQSIVASKALLTQTSNATQVFTQELDYDSTAGDFGDDNQFDQLTSGTLTDLNGHSVNTKVLLKPSSIKLGE